MASQRKTARLFNNLAVAFTIVFLTIHLRARGGSTGVQFAPCHQPEPTCTPGFAN